MPKIRFHIFKITRKSNVQTISLNINVIKSAVNLKNKYHVYQVHFSGYFFGHDNLKYQILTPEQKQHWSRLISLIRNTGANFSFLCFPLYNFRNQICIKVAFGFLFFIKMPVRLPSKMHVKCIRN